MIVKYKVELVNKEIDNLFPFVSLNVTQLPSATCLSRSHGLGYVFKHFLGKQLLWQPMRRSGVRVNGQIVSLGL